MNPACVSCGFQPADGQHRRDRRPMFPVVDEHGSYQVCGLCLLDLLLRVDGNAWLLLDGSVAKVLR